jgi:hypothetical protein
MNDDFPAGAQIYREYDIRLDNGEAANIAFTLGDRNFDSPARTLAGSLGAEAFGLISIVEGTTGRRHLFVWTHDDRELAVTMAHTEGPVTKEVRSLIARYICIFLSDIAALLPRLADLAPLQPINDNAGR